jgi:UDP-glucuronate 4-epimerase
VSEKTILVTGAAGFIGSHTAEGFLRQGYRVVGLDNFNDYYDPSRKRSNIEEIKATPEADRFLLVEGDICDRELVKSLYDEHDFTAVVHLAAMAGVRASIERPGLYFHVNVDGTLNLLEEAREHETGNFVFASTSSAYGLTEQIPFVETDGCNTPVSPYAASKRAAELLAFTFHHLHGLNVTAVRFFTVYGPRGRPDMMAYKVLDSIDSGREIPLYNGGQMHRDWTYVDDIVSGVVAAAERPLGWEVINLGRGEPVLLKEFVDYLETVSGKTANMVSTPMLAADVMYTFADISKAARLLDYDPKVSVKEGIDLFWDWYQRAVPRDGR